MRAHNLQRSFCALSAGGFLALCSTANAGAASLDEILKRNELVVCAHADSLPYSSQRGTPDGFQIDLGRALATELGVALRVQFMRLHREPRRKECDALISVAVPKNPDADIDYLVSDAYMAYRPVIVVPQARPPIRAFEDLADGPVAVLSGSWAHFLLTQRDMPVWVRYRTEDEIVGAVENDGVTAGIVSQFSLGWYLKNHPHARVRESTGIVLDEDLGFDVAVGLMEADRGLLDRVNASLANMHAKGIIAATLERYGIALELPTRVRHEAKRQAD